VRYGDVGATRFLARGREIDRVKHLFWLAELDQWDNPNYLEVLTPAIPGNGCIRQGNFSS
jgi:hypothetical protein